MDEKNTKKLQKLLSAMDENSMTQEEFFKAFENVVKHVLTAEKNIMDKNEKEISEMKEMHKKMCSEMESGNTEGFNSLKEEILNKFDKLFKDQQSGMNLMRDKIREIKNGKDADEEKIVKNVLSQIKIPEPQEIKPETPEETRDKLESIQNEPDKLKIEAIGYLRKEIDDLKNLVKTISSNSSKGGGFRASRSMMTSDLSSQTNGVKITFDVPKSISSFLLSSDFPSPLMQNNGFTLNATRTQLTLTTDNPPSSGSQLLYVYSSVFNV